MISVNVVKTVTHDSDLQYSATGLSVLIQSLGKGRAFLGSVNSATAAIAAVRSLDTHARNHADTKIRTHSQNVHSKFHTVWSGKWCALSSCAKKIVHSVTDLSPNAMNCDRQFLFMHILVAIDCLIYWQIASGLIIPYLSEKRGVSDRSVHFDVNSREDFCAGQA